MTLVHMHLHLSDNRPGIPSLLANYVPNQVPMAHLGPDLFVADAARVTPAAFGIALGGRKCLEVVGPFLS